MVNNNELSKFIGFKEYLLKNKFSVNDINSEIIEKFLSNQSNDIKLSVHEQTLPQKTIYFDYFTSANYTSPLFMRGTSITKNEEVQKKLMSAVSMYQFCDTINFIIYLNWNNIINKNFVKAIYEVLNSYRPLTKFFITFDILKKNQPDDIKREYYIKDFNNTAREALQETL